MLKAATLSAVHRTHHQRNDKTMAHCNTKKGMAKGGMAKKFPDLNKDGKVTKADILKGRGVKGFNKGGYAKCGASNPPSKKR